MRSLHLGFTVKINTNLNDQKYDATIISMVPTILEKINYQSKFFKRITTVTVHCCFWFAYSKRFT